MTGNLLRIPGYRLWLAGRAVSWFADTVMMLALGMWVKQLTGSSSRAGFTMTFGMLPSLLAPLAGMLVDRGQRRTLLVLGNAVAGLSLVPLLWVHTAGDVWIIWTVALVYGASGVLLPAASVALQRSMVPDDLLAHAQGLQQSVSTILQLFAPIIGAALFTAWGGRGPAVLACGCFRAGALAFLALRNPPAQQPPDETTLLAEMTAGMRHVWRTRPLLDAVIALLMVEAVGGLLEGAIYSVTDTFHRPVWWVSVVAVVQGIGMVAGALASARIITRLGETRAMALGLGAAGLGACAAAAAPTIWIFLGVVCALGAFLPLVFVAESTLQQRLTPPQLMGRVGTATSPLFTVTSVASLGVGSALVAFWSFRELYPIVGAGCLAAVAYLALVGRRRGHGPRASTPESPGPALAEP